MTAAGYLAGTGLLAVLVVLSAVRYLGASAGRVAAAGLGFWLVYVGTLSALGVVGNPNLRPPGVLYIVIPVITFVALFAVRSTRGGAVARALPIGLLMGAQVFRVGVEWGLHRLWEQGLVPRLMTYEGGNVDVFIGLSAPVVAWLVHVGIVRRRLAIAWNVLGLLALVNIVARSALTAPGPLNFMQAEVPNLAIGLFPYTFIAGFFAPLAVLLHVMSIRHLRSPLPTPGDWSNAADRGTGDPGNASSAVETRQEAPTASVTAASGPQRIERDETVFAHGSAATPRSQPAAQGLP